MPSMDGKIPVDVERPDERHARGVPVVLRRDADVRSDVEEFHKTTYQNPPDGGLISEGAAAYRDPETARHAFADLVGRVYDCGSTELGTTFVGEWTADADSLRMRSSGSVRSRLPGQERRAGRGVVLLVPGVGARHRDDEHDGQGAQLGTYPACAMVALRDDFVAVGVGTVQHHRLAGRHAASAGRAGRPPGGRRAVRRRHRRCRRGRAPARRTPPVRAGRRPT